VSPNPRASTVSSKKNDEEGSSNFIPAKQAHQTTIENPLLQPQLSCQNKVSLSKAAHGIFQSDQHTQASGVMRDGRLFLLVGSSVSVGHTVPNHSDPSHQHNNDRHAAFAPGKKSRQSCSAQQILGSQTSVTDADVAPRFVDLNGPKHENNVAPTPAQESRQSFSSDEDSEGIHNIPKDAIALDLSLDTAPADAGEKSVEQYFCAVREMMQEDKGLTSAGYTELEREPQDLDLFVSRVQKNYQAEVHALTAQLMGAREQAEQLKEKKEQQMVDLSAEQKVRRDAEEEVKRLWEKIQQHEEQSHQLRRSISEIKEQAQNRIKTEAAEAAKENLRLKTEKVNLEKSNAKLRRDMAQLLKMKGANVANSKNQACASSLAGKIADMECGPLKSCAAEEKAALKKKLLLKWHPDKQPTPDHAALATQVMQEMQNRASWKDELNLTSR
jgi:hypothetical protein